MRIQRPQMVWLFPFPQGIRYLCGGTGGRLAVKLFGFPARSFFRSSRPPFFEGFWVSKRAQVFELFEVLCFKVAFHLFALEFSAYGAWTRLSKLPTSFTPGKAIISQDRSSLVIHTTQSRLSLCCLLSKASISPCPFHFRDATDPCDSQFQLGPLLLNYPTEQPGFLLSGCWEEPWQSSSGMWAHFFHVSWNSPQWASRLYNANLLLSPNSFESFNLSFNIKLLSQPPPAHSQETAFDLDFSSQINC